MKPIIYDYELTRVGEIRMGAGLSGLILRHDDKEWSFLSGTAVFLCIRQRDLRSKIQTTRCVRYDIIEGWEFTFVIDKVDETASLLKGKYRVDNTTVCEDFPAMGDETRFFKSPAGLVHVTHYPFVPFDEFWKTWEKYVKIQKEKHDVSD